MNTGITQQIVPDTETTGINQIGAHYEGHKIIEIGTVEMVNRRLTGNNSHVYPKPDWLVDPEAFGVHGIADEFLLDKPMFVDVVDGLLDYIHGAEPVIHNASFDIGFMDYEFAKLKCDILKTNESCKMTDSLALARKMFPGKRNSLDTLRSRYEIDNSKRTLHGALSSAQILADVYLMMTGGQATMAFSMGGDSQQQNDTGIQRIVRQPSKPRVVFATNEELVAHESHLDLVQKKGGSCLRRTQFARLPYENGHSGDLCSKRLKA